MSFCVIIIIIIIIAIVLIIVLIDRAFITGMLFTAFEKLKDTGIMKVGFSEEKTGFPKMGGKL